jgi:putative addiction module component (TIGR02574 family)
MNARTQALLEQAKLLSIEERATLASELLESIEPMTSLVADEWVEELRARLAAFDAGADQSEPAEKVLRQARQLLKR